MLHLRLQNPGRGSSPVMIYHNRFSLLSPAQMSLTLQVLPMHDHIWLLLSFSWVCYKEYLKNIVHLQYPLGFPGGSSGKESACQTRVAGGTGLIPGSKRSPEEEIATHSSVLAWEISWMEEPGGLQPIGSQRVRHN